MAFYSEGMKSGIIMASYSKGEWGLTFNMYVVCVWGRGGLGLT